MMQILSPHSLLLYPYGISSVWQDCMAVNVTGLVPMISSYLATSNLAWHKVLLGTGYFFFAVHAKGFTDNYPLLFEGLQNILKGM